MSLSSKSNLLLWAIIPHITTQEPHIPFPFHYIPLQVTHTVPRQYMNEHELFNKPLTVQLYTSLD